MCIRAIASPPQDGRRLLLREVTSPRKRDIVCPCDKLQEPAIFTIVPYKLPFSIQKCRSCYGTQHLCQRSFYKIFVKFRNSKKNVLKMVLIIVNINKDENKSLISN